MGGQLVGLAIRREEGEAMSEAIKETLTRMGACSEAVEWAAKYKNARQRAWGGCRRPDWMLWYLGKMVKAGLFPHKKLVLLACACARTALPFADGPCPQEAIETAESWARDEGATISAVRLAADAIAYPPNAASNAAVYAAAYAAAAAVYAAVYAAADAAHAAASAANAASNAAANAAAGASYVAPLTHAAYVAANAAHAVFAARAANAAYVAANAARRKSNCKLSAIIRSFVPKIREYDTQGDKR